MPYPAIIEKALACLQAADIPAHYKKSRRYTNSFGKKTSPFRPLSLRISEPTPSSSASAASSFGR